MLTGISNPIVDDGLLLHNIIKKFRVQNFLNSTALHFLKLTHP